VSGAAFRAFATGLDDTAPGGRTRISGQRTAAFVSRLPVATFVVACLGLLAALWIADRALARTALPDVGALRLASWLLGAAAVAAATAGVRQERRRARRTAERSAELERLSEELFQANRAKSEFLANVSHELRTPLNAVVGFAELLQEGVYGELTDRQTGPVQRIAASASHLRHLVDQILDLAKIAAGRLEVHPELVVLRPFVLDVAGEMESLVREKGLTLSIGVPASLPKLRSDPLHVRQVLVNLLGNAVKFTPAGGRVSVRASLVQAPVSTPPFPVLPGRSVDGTVAGAFDPGDGGAVAVRTLAAAVQRLRRRLPTERRGGAADRSADWVALQVVDTGAGIAPDHQARIFDEFEQLGSRTGDSAVRGTGLGLAISRRLAHLLDGELTVDSVLGEGSTFTLWLPVDPEDVRPTRRSDRRQGDRRQQDRRTLAVDAAAAAPVGGAGGAPRAAARPGASN
jgi:signal transduction histidine kinase